MRAAGQSQDPTDTGPAAAGSLPRKVLETIARALVEKTDRVEVREVSDAQNVVLELKVAEEETGKVIGKQGRTAKAIRTVVKAAASGERRKLVVEIL